MFSINKESKETIKASLDNIAKNLILRSSLIINDRKYFFTDLEVYYYHEAHHPDEFANGVDHEKACGELEMHRYGIDISLGNVKKIDFGGILIRGLYDSNQNIDSNKKVIQKSDVPKTIFNNLNIGQNQISIVQDKATWNRVFKSKRLNLGKPDTTNKVLYSSELYRYVAYDIELFKHIKGKEYIIKNSDLNEEDRSTLLSYNLTS